MKLKLTALILILAIALSCVAGCTSSDIRSYSEDDVDATETAEATDAADTTEEPAEEARDYSAAYAAYDPDEVVLTVNGVEVTWDEYFYWMFDAASSIEAYYGTIMDWDDICAADSVSTNREFVQNYALDVLKQRCAIKTNAEDAGANLSAEDNETLQGYWDAAVESYGNGSEDEFIEYISNYYLNREIYDNANAVSLYYSNNFELMYGEKGADLSDEDAMEYAIEQEMAAAKHILLLTTDDEGEALSDEVIAEKRELLEGFIAEINAAEDKEAKFDELMNEYSEDTGLAYYPDGYCYTPGTMMTEFEDGVLALEEGELAQELVETSYGYHLILRIPVTPDSVVDIDTDLTAITVRWIAAETRYDSIVSGWIDEATVVFEDKFKDLDIAKIFG